MEVLLSSFCVVAMALCLGEHFKKNTQIPTQKPTVIIGFIPFIEVFSNLS
ncbi:MAG: hypothetical protein ACI9FR_000216 [Cryomorphaceae bacterium]|jgi:hypothetical protein